MSTAMTNPALIPPTSSGLGAPVPVGASASVPASNGLRAPLPASGAPAPAGAPRRVGASPGSEKARPAFAEHLQKASDAQPLQFSRHALQRVQRRGISLDNHTLARLNEGVGRAAGNGSRDSVVLVDGTAFVVAVGSRTVLTAIGAEHMREQVFTNIDSAVIA